MLLRVESLRVEGERGRPILDIAHLEVAAGATLGIRGPSGAGKTTLLHALSGLLRPASGSIRWDGVELSRLGEAARAAFRRARIGLVFQDFLLFEELSALDNAAIAAAYAPWRERPRIRAGAATALERLGLGGQAGRSVARFSGGERQRVAIARALAGDPDILLADEPTASLDRAAADRLIADLAVLAGETGKTLIAVSHDESLQARMGRVLDMAEGRLVADSRDLPGHAAARRAGHA